MYAARLSITEANAIAGITYGLPPITAIGGLVVNLGLTLGTTVTKVCPIYHDWTLHATGDSFHQIAPALSTQKDRPLCGIQEEGRVDVEMTLVFNTTSDVELKSLWQFFTTHRVAGGYVTNCHVKALDGDDALPEGWCAEDLPFEEDGDKIGQALLTCQTVYFYADGKWQAQLPADEFVHMVGYRGISELYEPGTVVNARSNTTPFQFAEPIYRLARWIECQQGSAVTLPYWTLAKTPNLYFWSQRDVEDNTPCQF